MSEKKKLDITTEEVIDGIGVCNELVHIWHNGREPSLSFKHSVKDIRVLLEKLLTVQDLREAD